MLYSARTHPYQYLLDELKYSLLLTSLFWIVLQKARMNWIYRLIGEYFHDVVSYKEAIEKGLILSKYCILNVDINPWICFVQNIDKYTDYKVQAFCERISASAACGGLRGLGVGWWRWLYGRSILYLDNILLKECNICPTDFVRYAVATLIN